MYSELLTSVGFTAESAVNNPSAACELLVSTGAVVGGATPPMHLPKPNNVNATMTQVPQPDFFVTSGASPLLLSFCDGRDIKLEWLKPVPGIPTVVLVPRLPRLMLAPFGPSVVLTPERLMLSRIPGRILIVLLNLQPT